MACCCSYWRAGLAVDARADEFRQPRPWRLRDGGWLCLRGAGQPVPAGRSLQRCRWLLSRVPRSARCSSGSLYRHLYNRSHLDQVLFSVGLVFMSVAAVDYIMGSSRVFIKLPAALEGQIDFFGVGIGSYRLMIIVICGLLTAGLQLVLARTPVRVSASRRGRRPPRRQWAWHQCAAGVRLHFRVRMRSGRSRAAR